MAATMSTPRYAEATSRLESLPAELLERILLEAVRGVQPALTETTVSLNRRCMQETLSGQSRASKLLALRYVSRTIHNHAWRAFAKVIDETTFDLCSEQSMKNFVALTNCKDLTSWARKLTVTSRYTEHLLPEVGNVETGEVYKHEDVFEAGLLNRTQAIIKSELDWYPELWLSSDDYHSSTARTLQDAVRSSQLWQLILSCLEALPNIVNIHYCARRVAGRFTEVFREMAIIKDVDIFWYIYEHSGIQIGQDLLLSVLAQSIVLPKRLELVTEMNGLHCFTIQATIQVIKKVSSEVEVLILRDEFGEGGSPQNPPQALSTVAITRDTFPALRTLVLDGSIQQSTLGGRPLPSAMDVPTVANLVFRDTRVDYPRLVNFIALFRETLRQITFVDMYIDKYKSIFELCQNLNLERLDITDGYGDGPHEVVLFTDVPKALFYRAAKTVVVDPPKSMDALARHWAENEVTDTKKNE
ncbi:uncharacterized protein J4E88_008378 [Alternaria novae-zelandiae]|uniref:uncharacterized protein n=1 Tax=Alternaria novae-zelandiae TaxID=430562 RepID=UPI0020C59A6D|nr:uncharacterized protein J4E88_008378 [Alternaria novae-zelandiae]KAI4673911.1 hypothetical protein J4E88_008378 [Alternaria novae-zelandiae]